MLNIEQMIEMAKEIEISDPIDWGTLEISEDDAYKLIAYSVYEMWEEWKEMNEPQDIMITTILKLVVENFVLNMKLLQLTKGSAYGETET